MEEKMFHQQILPHKRLPRILFRCGLRQTVSIVATSESGDGILMVCQRKGEVVGPPQGGVGYAESLLKAAQNEAFQEVHAEPGALDWSHCLYTGSFITGYRSGVLKLTHGLLVRSTRRWEPVPDGHECLRASWVSPHELHEILAPTMLASHAKAEAIVGSVGVARELGWLC